MKAKKLKASAKKKALRYGITVLVMLTALCALSCRKADTRTPPLIWWMIGTSQPGFSKDMKVISDYVEEKINIRLNIKQAGWWEADQRFLTMINAGEYYDIMFVDGSNYARFLALNAFADLTGLLPNVAPELWDYIPEVLWEGVKVKGRIFSVPTYKDSSRTGFYFWDHRFVEKYGIDLTRSGWAYLDKVFRQIKEGEGNPRFYPLFLTRHSDTFIFEDYDGLSALLPAIGIRHDDPERRVVNVLEQPDIKKAFHYFHSWYKDGIINPDANMVDETPTGLPFFIAQAWPSAAISYAISNEIGQYDPVHFSGPLYSTSSIQGSMNAISANSRYKNEALLLLQLINTDKKLRDMLHMGIEGKHFEYTNNGTTIKRLQTDWPLVNYQQGSYFIQTPLDSAPPGYWDEVRSQNENAFPSVMLGFMLDAEPVFTELMNCRSVWDKYASDMTTGAANPDLAIPQLISELKANGFDKVLEEAQWQVNEYYGKR